MKYNEHIEDENKIEYEESVSTKKWTVDELQWVKENYFLNSYGSIMHNRYKKLIVFMPQYMPRELTFEMIKELWGNGSREKEKKYSLHKDDKVRDSIFIQGRLEI